MTAATNTLELTGLREDILRDHLASLGLLDWIMALLPEYAPKLGWSADSGHPILYTSKPLNADWPSIVLKGLQAWRALNPNPLGHGKIEAIDPIALRGILTKKSDPRLLRFYCGLTSQIVVEKSGRRSELIIESASRSVLKGVHDLLADPRKNIDLEGDLKGTGTKREVSNTSRWHPAEYQPAAHVATDPQFNKHQDRVGLNILALFGTSFYPVIDTAKGRATVGFRRHSRITQFSWPVWETSLAIDEIRVLLAHPSCHAEPADAPTLALLGIHRIWRAKKFKPDGNNDYFSTAMPA